jgi:uncharacterized damage-inducible protein DinB
MQMATSLAEILEGWDGYNASIVRAIQGLSPDQLAFRLKPEMRSVGEIARHIAIGRLGWFVRMNAPGSANLAASLSDWHTDGDGSRHPLEEQVPLETDEIVKWLERSWSMIQATLDAWSPEDLRIPYRHTFRGVTYAVTRQWTLFRILAHDIHHGGQLSLLLDMQGADAPDLIYLGGHIVEPTIAV